MRTQYFSPRKFVLFIYLLLSLFSANSLAAEGQVSSSKDINQTIQNLKNEVLELNRDLFILEEDLLFSANTQVNVFLSMDAGQLFKLDSVQLKIDDKLVSNYLYTDREIRALQRGGVQRLYIGNMSAGEHEITAFFIGIGPNGRDYKRGTTQKVEKTDEALYIELKIVDNTSKEQPEFGVKVWE